jgi:hypothetical protein
MCKFLDRGLQNGVEIQNSRQFSKAKNVVDLQWSNLEESRSNHEEYYSSFNEININWNLSILFSGFVKSTNNNKFESQRL